MINFLCGLFIGINLGIWGLVAVALAYDKRHPDE